jgi:hypothetical protein
MKSSENSHGWLSQTQTQISALLPVCLAHFPNLANGQELLAVLVAVCLWSRACMADISIHRIAINVFIDFLSSFPDKVQRA